MRHLFKRIHLKLKSVIKRDRRDWSARLKLLEIYEAKQKEKITDKELIEELGITKDILARIRGEL